MDNQKFFQSMSQIYLLAIPLATAILGFTVNNIGYQIYLPIWSINVCLMLAALWMLGTRSSKINDKQKTYMAVSGLLLIAPWLFYSIFAGMGSPPGSYAQWVATAFEQQIRYSFLIIGGILLLFGFAVLREIIKTTGGNSLSLIGFAAVSVAMTLFILNMSYWHSFLLQTFQTEEVSSLHKLPDWYQPVKKLFLTISIVEVSLTYLATAAFAVSLRSAGWFKKGASRIYMIISLLAFFCVAFYGFYPDTITTDGFPFYPFMIPAIPFVMPYYMGVNLLRHTGNKSSVR